MPKNPDGCQPSSYQKLPIDLVVLLDFEFNVSFFFLNPRPDGSLDFPPPAGGGVFEHPPSISAPAHRRTKRKTAFESLRKIISKSFRSFFGSGKN